MREVDASPTRERRNECPKADHSHENWDPVEDWHKANEDAAKMSQNTKGMSDVIFTFGDGNLFYINCGSEHTTHWINGDAKLNYGRYGHFTGKIWPSDGTWVGPIETTATPGPVGHLRAEPVASFCKCRCSRCICFEVRSSQPQIHINTIAQLYIL